MSSLTLVVWSISRFHSLQRMVYNGKTPYRDLIGLFNNATSDFSSELFNSRK